MLRQCLIFGRFWTWLCL